MSHQAEQILVNGMKVGGDTWRVISQIRETPNTRRFYDQGKQGCSKQ